MLTGKRIRLLPTSEQETLFRKSAGAARWAYNHYIDMQKETYARYVASGGKGVKFIPEGEIRRHITRDLKPTSHQWLCEVGCNVVKQAVKDADRAMRGFFTKKTGFPKFKSRKRSKPSFYVNYESLRRMNGGFRGERIGFVRTSEPLPKLRDGEHYLNPHISFDGKYWYLSFAYDNHIIPPRTQKNGVSVGVDLGVKELAVCHGTDGTDTTMRNINKTRKARNLERRLRRQQRKAARQRAHNIDHYQTITGKDGKPARKPVWTRPLEECHNLNKTNRRIRLTQRKLDGLRDNHIHQMTAMLTKTKPARIVIEDLNVSGMMKNRHLADSIAKERFFEIRRQLEYKCRREGVRLTVADRFYPSSKTCSNCGNVRGKLTLRERTYKCEQCGLRIDRDLNAAINLAEYVPAAIGELKPAERYGKRK